MHTFAADHNIIEWILQVEVSIRRWPDVNETYPFIVFSESVTADLEAPAYVWRLVLFRQRRDSDSLRGRFR